jgi:hypothetical protein
VNLGVKARSASSKSAYGPGPQLRLLPFPSNPSKNNTCLGAGLLESFFGVIETPPVRFSTHPHTSRLNPPSTQPLAAIVCFGRSFTGTDEKNPVR